jgi:hypothetical protein
MRHDQSPAEGVCRESETEPKPTAHIAGAHRGQGEKRSVPPESPPLARLIQREFVAARDWRDGQGFTGAHALDRNFDVIRDLEFSGGESLTNLINPRYLERGDYFINNLWGQIGNRRSRRVWLRALP